MRRNKFVRQAGGRLYAGHRSTAGGRHQGVGERHARGAQGAGARGVAAGFDGVAGPGPKGGRVTAYFRKRGSSDE